MHSVVAGRQAHHARLAPGSFGAAHQLAELRIASTEHAPQPPRCCLSVLSGARRCRQGWGPGSQPAGRALAVAVQSLGGCAARRARPAHAARQLHPFPGCCLRLPWTHPKTLSACLAGKYLLVRDPNKPQLTLYAVPAEELDHRQYEGEPGGAAEED